MIDKIKAFFDEVFREIGKVIWPDFDSLVNSTFVVFVISAIFTLFIYFADVIVSWCVNMLYS